MDENLLAQGIRHTTGAEFLGAQGILQMADGPCIAQPALLCCPQQMEARFPAVVKTGVQRLAGVAAARQPVPSQPQHHPLIGL